MSKPTLYVVAGANGSGKSTLINKHRNLIKGIEFVNPDDIAKEIDPSYDGKNNALTLKASREAIIRQNSLLDNKQTFGIETTFSGNRELRIMQNAKKLGYEIKLVYIGLNNPITNVKRVTERTKNGGHFVDTQTIMRRYDRSMNNLSIGIKIADKTYLVDNTESKDFIVAKVTNEKVISVTNKNVPKWIRSKPNLYSKIKEHIRYKEVIKEIINKRDNPQQKNLDRGR